VPPPPPQLQSPSPLSSDNNKNNHSRPPFLEAPAPRRAIYHHQRRPIFSFERPSVSSLSPVPLPSVLTYRPCRRPVHATTSRAFDAKLPSAAPLPPSLPLPPPPPPPSLGGIARALPSTPTTSSSGWSTRKVIRQRDLPSSALTRDVEEATERNTVERPRRCILRDTGMGGGERMRFFYSSILLKRQCATLNRNTHPPHLR
jgi:hypothetical protein